jgi:tetratricopeptide (TPR) repeat protein
MVKYTTGGATALVAVGPSITHRATAGCRITAPFMPSRWLLALQSLLCTLAMTDGGGGWASDPELWALVHRLPGPRCALSSPDDAGAPSAAVSEGVEEGVHESDAHTQAQAQAKARLLRMSAGDWPAHWSDRDAFVDRYGGVWVEQRGSLVTAQGGASRQQDRHLGRGQPLREVLHTWGNTTRAGANDLDLAGRVVFESAGTPGWREVGESCSADTWWPAMKSELQKLLHYRQRGDDGDQQPLLSIAPSREGLARHTHGAAWLALLASGGGKWWLLHPPNAAGTAWATERRSSLQWLRLLAEAAPHSGQTVRSDRNATKLPPGVQWCLQLPGEVLILPAFWHHQTLNIGDSVAVGGQSNAMQWTNPREAVAQLEERLETSSTAAVPNPRLLEALSDAHRAAAAAIASSTTRSSSHDESSLRYMLKAIAAEPLNSRLALRGARGAHELGRHALAAELLTRATHTVAELEASRAINPTDAIERGGQLGVAIVRMARVETARALPLLHRAVAQLAQLPHAGPVADIVELLYCAAYAHGKSGLRDEAIVLLRRVLELDPTHTDARQILHVMQGQR